MPARRTSGLALVVAITVICGLSACGSDDDQPAPSETPIATRTTSPTPTSTPSEPAHTENVFGSTQPGGGALTIDARPEVEVFLSACLGGNGADCAGGTAVYTGTDPGFEEAEDDEPEEPLFTLTDGVPIRLQVTALDPGVSLQFDAVTLDGVGQSILIGTSPGIHQDLQWHLQVPGGPVSGTHSVTVKLTTTSSLYAESSEYTFPLVASPAAAE